MEIYGHCLFETLPDCWRQLSEKVVNFKCWYIDNTLLSSTFWYNCDTFLCPTWSLKAHIVLLPSIVDKPGQMGFRELIKWLILRNSFTQNVMESYISVIIGSIYLAPVSYLSNLFLKCFVHSPFWQSFHWRNCCQGNECQSRAGICYRYDWLDALLLCYQYVLLSLLDFEAMKGNILTG